MFADELDIVSLLNKVKDSFKMIKHLAERENKDLLGSDRIIDTSDSEEFSFEEPPDNQTEVIKAAATLNTV